MKTALTAENDWGEGAAGDPQVVGIFLCNELLHGQIPQAKVPIGGTGHKHLTTRAEGAGYQRGVTYCSSPSQKKIYIYKYGQYIWIYKIYTDISYLCSSFT